MATTYRTNEDPYERDARHGRRTAHLDDDRGVPAGLLSRISWGAVFAGAVTVVASVALLSMLGLAIGFGTIDPATDEQPLSGITTGTIFWVSLTGLLAMLAGGFVAGRLAGLPKTMTGALHGVVVWGLSSLAIMYFAGNQASYLMTGAYGLAAQTAQAVGTAASGAATLSGNAVSAAYQAAPDQLPASVRNAMERRDLTIRDARQELVQMLNTAGITQQDAQQAAQATQTLASEVINSPSDAGQDFQQYADKLLGGPNAVISDQERQNAIQVLQQRTGISREEAMRQLNTLENQVAESSQALTQAANQAQEYALQSAEATMETLSQATFAAFIASLLGLAAAVFGASIGAPSHARMIGEDDDDY